MSRVISVLQKSRFLINALSRPFPDCVGEFLASQEVQTRRGMSGLSAQLRRHGQVDTKVKGGGIHIRIGGLG